METPEELLGNSEYNNAADLLGDEPEFSEAIRRIAGLPKEKQSDAIKSLMKSKRPIYVIENNSRIEFQTRFKQLPKEIKDGLLKKRLQLADARFYVVKDISDKNIIDQLQGTDQKQVGIANLANAKLEKDYWLLLSAMRLVYAVSPTGALTADFTHIPPIIRNGEFELKAGEKKIVALIGNDAFDTVGRTDVPIGYYKLHSVKIIEPQVEMQMPIKFTAASAPTTFLKVVFIGTAVIPF